MSISPHHGQDTHRLEGQYRDVMDAAGRFTTAYLQMQYDTLAKRLARWFMPCC